jgi:hypothetical protein
VEKHDSQVQGPDKAYRDMTVRERSELWLDKSRWTKRMAFRVLHPLRSAVNCDGVVKHPFWATCLQTLYDAACQATWDVRYKDPEDFDGDAPRPASIYAIIRSIPERKFPNRPPLSDIPTVSGGPWDKARGERFAGDFKELGVMERRLLEDEE